MVDFKFVPLSESDFDLMHDWLNRPHVTEWWDGTETLNQVQVKYQNKIEARFVFPYLIYLNEKPIGYIQMYIAKTDDPDSQWWPDTEEGTVGVDQLIGEAELINKGIGTAFVRQFTDELLKKDWIKKVIVDPTPENARAIRAYEKAGFNAVGEVVTPDGSALLMEKI